MNFEGKSALSRMIHLDFSELIAYICSKCIKQSKRAKTRPCDICHTFYSFVLKTLDKRARTLYILIEKKRKRDICLNSKTSPMP